MFKVWISSFQLNLPVYALIDSGISQRHTDMYHKYISENSKEIIADVQAFFYHIIKDNFPDKSCKYM